MKTLELLQILDKNERTVFVRQLKLHKRKSLYKLYVELQKGNNVIEKAQLFQATFGTPYAASKDYLLRNELRLLNNEIENFIVHQPLKESDAQIEKRKGLKFLTRLRNTGSYQLFNQYFNAAVEAKKNKHDYETLIDLYAIKIEFQIHHQEISKRNYLDLIELLQLQQQFMWAWISEMQSENKLKQNFAHRVLLQLGNTAQILETDYQAKLPKEANELTQYNELIAKSYLQHGQEKIETLLTALKLQPRASAIRPEKERDALTILGNIGLEYFLEHQFDQAHAYYKKANSLMHEQNLNIELLFNFCVNALAIGKHKVLIEMEAKYRHQIQSNVKLRYRFLYFTAIAYLFDNNPQQAFNLLDHEPHKRPEHEYYFYRLVYAMVYFQLRDYTLAKRELENILQSFRFRQSAPQYDKPLVKFMLRLTEVADIKGHEKYFSAALKKANIHHHKNSNTESQFSTIIYTWTKWQWKELQKKEN